MNYSIFIVRLFDDPIIIAQGHKGEEKMLETKVKIAIIQQKNVYNEILLNFWGDQINDFLKYYKIRDYLIIEGILSYEKNHKTKEIKMTVKQFYPFVLMDETIYGKYDQYF
ncbi:unnamed protein product [Discosporangium mesarthrocarpum]